MLTENTNPFKKGDSVIVDKIVGMTHAKQSDARRFNGKKGIVNGTQDDYVYVRLKGFKSPSIEFHKNELKLAESINEDKEWSTYEQRMVNQIKAAQKEGRGMYTLPMKTQDFYRKHKDKFDKPINEIGEGTSKYYDFQVTINPGEYLGATFIHRDGKIQKHTVSRDDNPLVLDYRNVPGLIKAAYRAKNDNTEITIWDETGKGKTYPFDLESIKLINEACFSVKCAKEWAVGKMKDALPFSENELPYTLGGDQKTVWIDMDTVRDVLRSEETDENLIAMIDELPPGDLEHPVFNDKWVRLDLYFFEQGDGREQGDERLFRLLRQDLGLMDEDIEIVLNDYVNKRQNTEQDAWFEFYDSHTRDEEWSGPAGGADVPPEEVHQAAEQAGIAWDGDEAFMDFSEKITGFRHIDTMTSELRLKLIDALKHAVPQIN